MVGPTTMRASNPRLMAQVLEAVKHLGEGRGSSAKEVLEILRRGKTEARTRNLAMQVQRALKNAVNAGLLKLRSGRYKILFSLKRRKDSRENESSKTPKKKEEIAKLQPLDSMPSKLLDAGPKNRCSNCKKQKRRRSRSSSKRRRKRSTKRGRHRPRKHAAKSVKDRKSRKLQRRGDEEVPRGVGGRSRRRKISASEVPERKVKSLNPDRNEEEEEEEEGRGEMEVADNRSRSSSPDAEGKTMTRGTKRRPGPVGARKKVPRASSSKRRRKRKSRKRSSSPYRVSSPAKDDGSAGTKFQKEEEEEEEEEDSNHNHKDLRMEFCDGEELNREQEINREDANDA